MNNRSSKRATGHQRIAAMEKQFDLIQKICDSIKEAGYDPYSQITGYLMFHNENYITRHLDARNKIKSVPDEALSAYLKQMKSE